MGSISWKPSVYATRGLPDGYGIAQRVGPQVLRRSLNASLRRAGVDAGTVRAIIGHTTEAMSSLYDHVHLHEKRDAIQAVMGSDVATRCGNTALAATATRR